VATPEVIVPTYMRAQTVSLKSHPDFSEKWLHERIAEDPSVLGLGDLEVRDVERTQARAGRLDLLLVDPETRTRYEVEIQLGSTDESHIIRTIEYWDNERRRFPDREHVAVLVAEDITSRFLNVISLFNKAIPLVALQLRALQVGDVLTLSSTKVLDLTIIGPETDETEKEEAADRLYWEKISVKDSLTLADELLDLVRQVTGDQAITLKYNKYYIGLARHGLAENFVIMRPRKSKVMLSEFGIPRSDELDARLEAEEFDMLPYDKRWRKYRLRLGGEDFAKRRDTLTELVQRAAGIPASATLTDEPGLESA